MDELIPWFAPWLGWVCMIAVPMLGLGLLVWAYTPRRGGPHCRKCDYSRSGLVVEARCPECGAPARKTRKGPRPRLQRTSALMGVVLVTSPAWFFLGRRVHDYGWDYLLALEPMHTILPRQTMRHFSHGSAEIRITIDRRHALPRTTVPIRIEIRSGGTPIYEAEDEVISAGPAGMPTLYPNDQHAKPGEGFDLTGDGFPELEVREFLRVAELCDPRKGTHALYDASIAPPRELIRLDNCADRLEFEDLDGDGDLEIRQIDATYFCWNTPFMITPRPEVILDYDPATHRMKPSPELMRSGTQSRYASKIQRMQRWLGSSTGKLSMNERAVLHADLLNLIYTGQAEEAKTYLRAIWPSEREELGAFTEAFLTRLAQSPYYESLLDLNGGTIWGE